MAGRRCRRGRPAPRPTPGAALTARRPSLSPWRSAYSRTRPLDAISREIPRPDTDTDTDAIAIAEADGWVTDWMDRLMAHALEGESAAVQGRPSWQTRGREIQAECATAERWQALWRLFPKTRGKERETVLRWLAHLVFTPQAMRQMAPAVSLAGVRTLCANPALTQVMGQVIEQWIALGEETENLALVLDDPLLAWYVAQPGLIAHVSAASRRRILLEGSTTIKVALVGALAQAETVARADEAPVPQAAPPRKTARRRPSP